MLFHCRFILESLAYDIHRLVCALYVLRYTHQCPVPLTRVPVLQTRAVKAGGMFNTHGAVCMHTTQSGQWHAGAPKFHFSALSEMARASEVLCSLQHFCATAEPGWSLCGMHAHENDHVPSAISVGFLCTSCGQFCASEGAPTVAVSELCAPDQGRSEEFTQV